MVVEDMEDMWRIWRILKLLYSYPPHYKKKHNVIFSYHYICIFYINIYNNIESMEDMEDMEDIFIN